MNNLAKVLGSGVIALALLCSISTTAVRAADKVEVGKPAPAINLPATQIDKVLPDAKGAKTLSLKDLQGKKNVVLYFFPKALTGG